MIKMNVKTYYNTVKFSGLHAFYVSTSGFLNGFSGSFRAENEFNDCEVCRGPDDPHFYFPVDKRPDRRNCRVCYGTGRVPIPEDSVDYTLLEEVEV